MEFSDLLQQPQQDKKYFEILKEYVNPKNIMLFSELEEHEVKFMTKLMFLEWLVNTRFNADDKHKVIDFSRFIMSFMKNRVNLKRKSREEFKDSMKGERPYNTELHSMRFKENNMRMM